MTTFAARMRATPGIDAGVSAYGPVEITWFDDHLEITAVGVGRAAVREASSPSGEVVVEIRPPDELPETVPGAD